MHDKTLEMLIARAAAARDTAASRRVHAERLVQQARASLAQLQRYAADYAARARAQRAGSLDIAAEMNLRAFDAKLHDAVRTQANEVESRARNAATVAAEVAACERKLRSLEKLVQRRAVVRLRVEDRREQKFNDEIASRATAAFADTEGTPR